MISHTLKNVDYVNSRCEIDGHIDVDITVLGDATLASCPRWIEKYGTADVFLFNQDISYSGKVLKDFFERGSTDDPQSSKYFELICKKYNYSWFAENDGYYDESFNSDDWKMRALVAMNGMYLNELSNDKHPVVRQKVLSYLIKNSQDHKIGMGDTGWVCFDDLPANINYMTYIASIDNELENIDYIDKLVKDDDKDVRYELASLGIQKHLDALVDDVSPIVRIMVAKRGHASHLAKLAVDSDSEVRLMVARNQNTPHDTLSAMSNNPLECESVQLALVLRGFISDNLISSPHFLVKMRLANLGHAHHILYKDPEDVVRSAVASNTTDDNLLNILKTDTSEVVRDAINERGYNF